VSISHAWRSPVPAEPGRGSATSSTAVVV
jgi:hypothetical protein